MPLLLSQDDLRPLVENPEHLSGAFEAIQAAVLEHHRGESGHVGWLVHQLDHGHSAALYSTSSVNGLSLRVYPNVGVAQNVPNSHLWLLFDGTTGELLSLLCCDDLNALRTAVPVGVGARHLAPKDARTLCMLGTGRQARAQIRTVLHGVRSLRRVVVWSPTAEHREAYAEEMRRSLDADVRAVASCQEAVEQADVVCVAGRVRDRPAFEGKWVRPGALVVSVTRTSQPALEARIVVPALRRPRALVPAGPEVASSMPHPQQPLELAEVIRGASKPREHEGQTLLFDLAAMYGWDTPMMRWAYDWARASGVGTEFRLTSDRTGFFPAW